jgi:PAS domain S-box-containing protein
VEHRILIVDDEKTHLELLRAAFQREAPADTFVCCRSAEEMFVALNQNLYDVIILDYFLPDLDGITVVKRLREQGIETPIIIATGHGDENIAVQMMKLGVADYIVKGNNFPHSVPTTAYKVIDRYQLHRRIETAEEHLRFQALLLDSVHDAIISTDLNNRINYWNRGATAIFQRSAVEVVERNLLELLDFPSKSVWEDNLRMLLEKGEYHTEWCGLTAQNQTVWLSVRSQLLTGVNNQILGILNVARDITEQKRLQEQKLKQLKQTAIINQVLTAINAQSDLVELVTIIRKLLHEVFQCEQIWLEPCPISLEWQSSALSNSSLLQKLQQTTTPEFYQQFTHFLTTTSETLFFLDPTTFDTKEWDNFLKTQHVRTQVFYSLRLRNDTMWFLGLWYQHTHLVSQWEKELLAEIGHLLTLGLEKSLIYHRMQNATAREHLLNRILQKVSQSLDPDEILQSICNKVGQMFKTDRCLFVTTLDNEDGIVTHEYRVEPWRSLIGLCYQRQKYTAEVQAIWDGDWIAVNSLADLAGLEDPALMETFQIEQAQAILAVPVIHQDQVLGALKLTHCRATRYWTQEEIILLQGLGRQCAIILHNAQLYRESRHSEERYRSLFDHANDAILIADLRTGQILDANLMAEKLTGYDRPTLLNLHLTALHPLDSRLRYQEFYETLRQVRTGKIRDAVVWRRDNGKLPVELSANIISSETEGVIQTLLRDMTEQQKLERQLLHSQRLESIGMLTGGIAHDFNNLLAGILGYAELFKKRLDPNETKLRNYASVIEQSATHGAELAQRLVAFARGGNPKPQIMNLNALIEDTVKLLNRALGRLVEIETMLESKLHQIEANATQMQQVIMNLCINARDAMPHGGTLTVRTENKQLPDIPEKNIHAGHYVCLSVNDTGSGMDEKTLEKIFEPFFTTKELGKGTGLGLAIISTIVREAKGLIKVHTVINQGTTFEIYLPAARVTGPLRTPTTLPAAGGTEVILVVDDEETLRNLAKDLLEAYGYQVLLAADGPEAIEVYEQHHHDIALVLLDVVMPKMSGHEVCRRLHTINSQVKVIFASGYCPPEEVDKIWQAGVMGFIPKPYQIEELAAELRLALDQKH